MDVGEERAVLLTEQPELRGAGAMRERARLEVERVHDCQADERRDADNAAAAIWNDRTGRERQQAGARARPRSAARTTRDCQARPASRSAARAWPR